MQEGKYLPKVLTHPVRPSVTVNSVMEEEQWTAFGYARVKIAEYSDYPKTLNHPDYTPPRLISPERHGAIAGDASNPMMATARLFSYVPAVWEPERFPPVTVRNMDEEELYLAKGYIPAGTPDRAAFSDAVAAKPVSQEREFLEFPKYATLPDGKPVLVRSKAEEDALAQRSVRGLK